MSEEIIESGCGNVTILAGDTVPDEINVTESAKLRIEEIMKNEPEGSFLRAIVEGGGCSGFQYKFAIYDKMFDDDIINEWDGGKVVIDSVSIRYMKGATLDYIRELSGEYFQIRNPSATSKCGCGSSFGV
jgi:iron-sulfur cluster assembly accessory protein